MIARLHQLREQYDAVLLDLDGTLLDPSYRVTRRTRRAVQALVGAGFEVVLCTGRSVAGAERYHAELGLETALVAYNGAWIGHPTATPWRYAPIPDARIPDVERVEALAGFSFRHNGGRKYSVVTSHPLFGRVARWYDAYVGVLATAELPRRELMRVSCYFDGAEAAERAWGTLDDEARRSLHCETYPMAIFREFVDTDLHLSEVQARSRGKAEVYAYLETVRGIPAARTIAVGDHRNDLSMLSAAGLAVSPANGTDEVQRVADLVIGHHAEEGLAAWLEAGAPGPDGPTPGAPHPPAR